MPFCYREPSAKSCARLSRRFAGAYPRTLANSSNVDGKCSLSTAGPVTAVVLRSEIELVFRRWFFFFWRSRSLYIHQSDVTT